MITISLFATQTHKMWVIPHNPFYMHKDDTMDSSRTETFLHSQEWTGAAVAQEVKQVVYYTDGRWFNSQMPPATRGSVYISVCMNVTTCFEHLVD